MTTAHHRLWVVLADGEHARVVSPSPEHLQFATRNAFDSITAHRPSHDLGTDRPGRSFESGGTLRHAITPKQDPHEAAKHDFLMQVAHEVNEQAAGGFDRLVLVAPAHALHDLREAMGAQAAGKMVGTLAKDLTKVPDHELSGHLAEWWLPPAAE